MSKLGEKCVQTQQKESGSGSVWRIVVGLHKIIAPRTALALYMALAMHGARVMLLGGIVTVVNLNRASVVGVTVVVKNLEEHWGLMKNQVHPPASVRDE